MVSYLNPLVVDLIQRHNGELGSENSNASDPLH